MKIIEYLSIKNRKAYNKPNEDYILTDNEKGIYVVLDGVSRDLENGVYPNPSPASKAAKVLADNILEYLHNNELSLLNNSLKTIKAAIQYGNSLVKQYNKNLLHSFLPGAVGIVTFINNNKLHYGYIGDSIGAIIHGCNVKVFTEQQTSLVRQHKGKFTKDEIRNEICNNINHPYCYGVLNGQEKALGMVKYGSMSLFKNDVVLLMTDGMEKIFDIFSMTDIKSLNCQKLIEGVEKLEDSYNFTDDKSIIKITI